MSMKAKTLEIAERRKVVAEKVLAGRPYRDIAVEVGVAPATITRDVQEILKALSKETLADAGRFRLIEQRRLDVALQAIWDLVLDGDLGAIDRLLKIQDQRAKYLPGLQEIPRHEVSGPGGGPIEYLDGQRRAAQELEELAAWEAERGIADAEQGCPDAADVSRQPGHVGAA